MNHEFFHKRLVEAIEKGDATEFDLILDERKEYIEYLTYEKKDAETLQILLKQDEELKKMIEKEQTNIQNFLVSQHQKKKVISKYEKY